MRKKSEQKKFETIIGKDTVIEGNIKLPTSLRIEGKVYGKIQSEGNVIIGKNGYAEPSITAKNLIVAGEASGDFETKEKTHIYSNGKVTGNITTKGLIIEDGGVFNGNSTIYASETKKLKSKETQKNHEQN